MTDLDAWLNSTPLDKVPKDELIRTIKKLQTQAVEREARIRVLERNSEEHQRDWEWLRGIEASLCGIIRGFYDAIKHGEDDHRKWLKDKIGSYLDSVGYDQQHNYLRGRHDRSTHSGKGRL